MKHVRCSKAQFNFRATCSVIKLKWSALNLIMHFGGADCICSCISTVKCSSGTVLYCMKSGYCIWSYNEQNISNLLIVKDYGPLGCSGHSLPLACLELQFFFHPGVLPYLCRFLLYPEDLSGQFLQCVDTYLHSITSQKTMPSLYSPQISLLLLFL